MINKVDRKKSNFQELFNSSFTSLYFPSVIGRANSGEMVDTRLRSGSMNLKGTLDSIVIEMPVVSTPKNKRKYS